MRVRMMQARCQFCAITYHWYGPPRLSAAQCSRCSAPLRHGRPGLAGQHRFSAPTTRSPHVPRPALRITTARDGRPLS